MRRLVSEIFILLGILLLAGAILFGFEAYQVFNPPAPGCDNLGYTYSPLTCHYADAPLFPLFQSWANQWGWGTVINISHIVPIVTFSFGMLLLVLAVIVANWRLDRFELAAAH